MVRRFAACVTVILLASTAWLACGGRTGLGGEIGDAARNGGDATDAATFSQCVCATRPDYAPCPKPLDCCPCNDDGLGLTVDRCKNPATFVCTCSHVLSCP